MRIMEVCHGVNAAHRRWLEKYIMDRTILVVQIACKGMQSYSESRHVITSNTICSESIQ